jgi:site-specific recombinase XerD
MSEDLRRFQLHMAQQQISAGSVNAAIAALRFFFNVTLERPDLVRHLTTVNKPRKASPLPGMGESWSGAGTRLQTLPLINC